jgi:hypothetical protein
LERLAAEQTKHAAQFERERLREETKMEKERLKLEERQGLTLVPFSAQLELTLQLSAQLELTLSPI